MEEEETRGSKDEYMNGMKVRDAERCVPVAVRLVQPVKDVCFGNGDDRGRALVEHEEM